MNDHKQRGKRYCPLMKEWCINGWTASMGKDTDGMPIMGACASWQPINVFDHKKMQTEEVNDCSIFGWSTDLLSEIAQEVSHGTSSTDKVATEVRKHHVTFIGCLPDDIKQRLMDADPKIAQLPTNDTPPERNGSHNHEPSRNNS